MVIIFNLPDGLGYRFVNEIISPYHVQAYNFVIVRQSAIGFRTAAENCPVHPKNIVR